MTFSSRRGSTPRIPWSAVVASGSSISIRCVQLAAPRSRSFTLADQPRAIRSPTSTDRVVSASLQMA
jgi:hypothetical protein